MISDDDGICDSAAQKKKPPKYKDIRDTNFKVGTPAHVMSLKLYDIFW